MAESQWSGPANSPSGGGMLFAGAVALAATSLVLVAWSASAAPPSISHIERFLTNQVLIHFDTEANRTYTLQYANSLQGTPAWSNLYTAPTIPFPNHYIVVDTMITPERYYRLSVTP
jgi:hypothetical protein